MTVKIEKDVPIPPVRSAAAKLPVGDMEIGDSILITASGKMSATAQCTVQARNLGKGERRFRSAAEGEKYRVWRVA